jgi:outer membrane protein OmpA-like peptidoglycan-associated protein
MGLLLNVSRNRPRTYLRFQVRDVMFRERDSEEFSHHVAVTAGIHYVLFGRVRDQDLDRVRDWLDDCPETPIGCTVNAVGCPSDADADSICDGVDQCASTPVGCKVDRTGCPIDSDGDGVCDGVDTCLVTPQGCTVDASGCPRDTDADGVCDGLDKCPNTVAGCPVDAEGCSADADRDSVCDALDQCPNTPAGVAVGPTGCPLEVNRFERELLDQGVIRVSNVYFETRVDSVLAERSQAVLDSVGNVLQQYPTLRIQIGAHVDDRGTEKVQRSVARANAVVRYMRSRFPQINWTQYTLRGYGSSQAIAPNTTERGRAQNRRIEFKVQNPDQLPAERQRREGTGGQ